jgi:hypothetical protein
VAAPSGAAGVAALSGGMGVAAPSAEATVAALSGGAGVAAPSAEPGAGASSGEAGVGVAPSGAVPVDAPPFGGGAAPFRVSVVWSGRAASSAVRS